MKAFALLRAFRSVDELLTSAELSRRAGLPEASGYRLIQTLESVGAVIRDGRGRYQAGFVTNLASAAAMPENLPDAAEDVLDALAARFGATIQAVFITRSASRTAASRVPAERAPAAITASREGSAASADSSEASRSGVKSRCTIRNAPPASLARCSRI